MNCSRRSSQPFGCFGSLRSDPARTKTTDWRSAHILVVPLLWVDHIRQPRRFGTDQTRQQNGGFNRESNSSSFCSSTARSASNENSSVEAQVEEASAPRVYASRFATAPRNFPRHTATGTDSRVFMRYVESSVDSPSRLSVSSSDTDHIPSLRVSEYWH
uniref:Uncharacterized protein n=1 Tax=Tetraselmis sp. GSL018 TaxID=582737 RepID=A0A061RDC6_9CHLO